MELPALVTLIALLEYMFFAMRVGFSREKHNVPAPATSGSPEWERMYRVQQNTLEQLIIFLPALWIFSYLWSPAIAAGIGVLFLIGRPLYFIGYVQAAEKRTLGFLLGFFANVVLMIGSLAGVIKNLM